MEISIWFPKEVFISVSPETQVYTMRLTDDMISNLLCDSCWTDKNEVTSHFWNKRPNKKESIKYISMTFRKYIEKHVKELSGMNPFWSIGRIEFLDKYNSKWNLDGNG